MPLIRYVGDQPRDESSVTANSSRWWPGEMRRLESGARANALLSARQGWELVTDADGATVQPLTAAQVQAVQARKAASRRLGNILTRGFSGSLSTQATGGNPHTTHIQMALEAHFDAVRIIIPNSVTSAISGVTAKFTAAGAAASAGASGAIAPADGAWKTVTWGGSSSVTLAAGASANAPSWTVSDWIVARSFERTDGGVQPLLLARVHVPGANANRPAWAQASSLRGRQRHQSLDASSAPGPRPWMVSAR